MSPTSHFAYIAPGNMALLPKSEPGYTGYTESNRRDLPLNLADILAPMDRRFEMRTGFDKASVTRRALIRWLLGFSVVSTLDGVLTPIISYLWPPARARSGKGGRTLVGNVSDFPLDSGTVVSVNDEPVIVVNSQAGGIKVYSAICTHLGCIVYWHKGRQVIQSPCHDGRFNPLNGAVISGPLPRPLPPYEFEIVDGKVYVGAAKGPTGPI
jgi:cytochrome b6-f complex iron-sulfur subunit